MAHLGMKTQYSFTIDETLMDWFRLHAKNESTTMSGMLNQHILSLKRGDNKPKNFLASKAKRY